LIYLVVLQTAPVLLIREASCSVLLTEENCITWSFMLYTPQ